MIKIKDIATNDIVDITLVVLSASARETRAEKPYLYLELSDGVDHIGANYWDWASGKIPAVNTVLDIKAQVTEWQGVKQLNIRSMTTCTTRQLADFAPISGYDLADIYKRAYSLMSAVSDEALRQLALALLEELRQLWLTVPGAIGVHHNYIGGTLVHSYNVAVKAKAMAEVTEGADVDIATVGGMLHDLGKLFTYTINGASIDMTPEGRLYEHLFIGAEFVGNFAETHVDTDNPYTYHKVRLLRHIILSHHGKLEYGSPVAPKCIEAYIVHFADMLDATNEQLRVASDKATSNWTDKLWALGNLPHLSHKYVKDLMNSNSDQ